mmetsp:Transcript_56838/g.184113  ORF Transcript_56838/g.184113 Transcript_56838/m.184113 type:complete len:274 (+) Transcript_56838:621-1442(+)
MRRAARAAAATVVRCARPGASASAAAMRCTWPEASATCASAKISSLDAMAAVSSAMTFARPRTVRSAPVAPAAVTCARPTGTEFSEATMAVVTTSAAACTRPGSTAGVFRNRERWAVRWAAEAATAMRCAQPVASASVAAMRLVWPKPSAAGSGSACASAKISSLDAMAAVSSAMTFARPRTVRSAPVAPAAVTCARPTGTAFWEAMMAVVTTSAVACAQSGSTAGVFRNRERWAVRWAAEAATVMRSGASASVAAMRLAWPEPSAAGSGSKR